MARAWVIGAWAVSVMLLAAGAAAQNTKTVRQTAEATMLVFGDIQIAPDGHVQSYTLDQQDKLPAEVPRFLAAVVPRWRFEPIEQPGAPASIHSRMSVRLVAKPLGDDYEMSVRSAGFSGDSQQGTRVSPQQIQTPIYPKLAAQVRATGVVYLVLEIGRDGKVIHADAAQTNLTVVTRERDMVTLRKLFERSALSVAKDWTFQTPTVGEAATNASWVVRIPVVYELRDHKDRPYGTWEGYVPGPRNPVPWLGAKIAADRDQGLETGANGQVSQLGEGPQLQTRLNAS